MDKILILDFGSQYTQLIARRIRENHVYSEIHPFNFPLSEIKKFNPKGIILSGGPSSVYGEGAPVVDPPFFCLDSPTLGMCYGMQLMGQHVGGRVQPSVKREYGRALIQVDEAKSLFFKLKPESSVWMSHGAQVIACAHG